MKHVLLLTACLVAAASNNTAHADKKIIKLFKEVDPAVVVLKTVERSVEVSQTGAREVSADGLGSGVLVDNAGHVVTAAHVVQTADRVTAEFIDGTKVSARVIAASTWRC